jgi:hypothetical protein
MTRLVTILLGLTFVMSVVTMVLVLLLFVTKPWDDAITEAELSEILQAAQETSSEEKEADRVAKCDAVAEMMRVLLEAGGGGIPDPIYGDITSALIENKCLPSP